MIKKEQVITEKYLTKYLTSCSLEQEIIIHTRQLHILNSLMVDKICKKK